MGKRYGRNQRRQHREEIARLQQELDLAKHGDWRRADGRYPSLEGLAVTVLEREVTDIETHRLRRRFAKLMIHGSDYRKLTEVYGYNAFVEWEGIVWSMCAIDFDGMRGYRGYDQMEIDLEALGQRSRPPRMQSRVTAPRPEWDYLCEFDGGRHVRPY